MNNITEGKAKLTASTGKVTAKMDVFYNPIMRLNRDMSILLINALGRKNLRIADPLAASGIRAVRLLLETKAVESISINDYSEKAVKAIIENLKVNKVDMKKVAVYNKDATLFLLESVGTFDYIDIDPFGTPNHFLDAAIKKIAKDGILAVTATDTSALAGSFPLACMRKYWAKPLRTEEMHEVGLRILARKIQLLGAQFDKALIPVLSFSTEHYYRMFFISKKGKQKVDKMLKMDGMYKDAGPMWLGELWDATLVKKLLKQADNKDSIDLLSSIAEEATIPVVGFYDLHAICKKNKIKLIPKREVVITAVNKKGYKASKTHFTGMGIRSDIREDKLVMLLKRIT